MTLSAVPLLFPPFISPAARHLSGGGFFMRTERLRSQPSRINLSPPAFSLLNTPSSSPSLFLSRLLLFSLLPYLSPRQPPTPNPSTSLEEPYPSLISSREPVTWGQSQCDFVVYSVSGRLKKTAECFVSRVAG